MGRDMGGIGSGRRWQFGAETTKSFRSIDIRWFKREGLLTPGNNRQVYWTRHGERVASISVRPEQGRLVLIYRHQRGGSDWQDQNYPVYLDKTPCHLGGERHWFRCPARGCGQRVAILYGGAVFACRNCHRLVYPSQRESEHDRAARKADRIREKLGWFGGILEGSDLGKPKGMHWRTYRRLCEEHDALAECALSWFRGRYGQFSDDPLALR